MPCPVRCPRASLPAMPGHGVASQRGSADGGTVWSGRALVLNVTYEPISVVGRRRALVLVLAGKADSLHDSDRTARSARLGVPIPSVVRLRYRVSVPFRRRAPLHRRSLFARDGGVCQYCGRPAECIDHIHPRSKGGAHEWENVVACCRSCNLRKADRLLSETGFELRTRPGAPSAFSWVTMSVGRVPEEWRQYLPVDLALSA